MREVLADERIEIHVSRTYVGGGVGRPARGLYGELNIRPHYRMVVCVASLRPARGAAD
jgi:hypothetical protein